MIRRLSLIALLAASAAVTACTNPLAPSSESAPSLDAERGVVAGSSI